MSWGQVLARYTCLRVKVQMSYGQVLVRHRCLRVRSWQGYKCLRVRSLQGTNALVYGKVQVHLLRLTGSQPCRLLAILLASHTCTLFGSDVHSCHLSEVLKVAGAL